MLGQHKELNRHGSSQSVVYWPTSSDGILPVGKGNSGWDDTGTTYADNPQKMKLGKAFMSSHVSIQNAVTINVSIFSEGRKGSLQGLCLSTVT